MGPKTHVKQDMLKKKFPRDFVWTMHKAREDWEASSKWSWRERKWKILKQKTLDRENRKYLTEKMKILMREKMKEARGFLESKTLLERKMKKSFPMTTWNENPSDTCFVQKYKKSKSMCSKSIFVNPPRVNSRMSSIVKSTISSKRDLKRVFPDLKTNWFYKRCQDKMVKGSQQVHLIV